jgi:hypothetical protein
VDEHILDQRIRRCKEGVESQVAMVVEVRKYAAEFGWF